MKIDTIKQLKSVIELCRKSGIDSIEIDGIKIDFGMSPESASISTEQPQETFIPGGVDQDTPIKLDEAWEKLTDDQKLYYSVTDQN